MKYSIITESRIQLIELQVEQMIVGQNINCHSSNLHITLF